MAGLPATIGRTERLEVAPDCERHDCWCRWGHINPSGAFRWFPGEPVTRFPLETT